MTVTLNSRKDFRLDNLVKVAWQGESVAIGKRARAAMNRARRSFMRLLDQDRSQFIYGTTSGAGQNASQTVPADEQRAHAMQLSRMPAGGGFDDESLPSQVVRMILFARLANYIEGHAKARPLEAERIAALLERAMPRVPLGGQVGAGEILPLFHVMNELVGSDVEEGEPMVRVNGSPVSAALICDVYLTASIRLAIAEQVFALAAFAYGAPLDYIDPALGELWQSPHEQATLRRLNQWLRGRRTRPLIDHQPPCSFRILPRVLGAADQAAATAHEVASTSLASVTDNPVYVLPDERHSLGRVLSTGGYHNAQATPAIDTLNARFADLCTLADRQTMRLHTADHLPTGLAPPAQDQGATTLLSFVQIGYGEEARHAAARTLLPPSEGGGVAGQNDVAVATMFAWRKHQRSAFCLQASLSLLAVCASQALFITDRAPPKNLAPLLATVRRYVKTITGRSSRKYGDEINRLRKHLDKSIIEKLTRGRTDFRR